MITIDYEEFKLFKKSYNDAHGFDNFALLIEFVKTYYNIRSYFELYDIFIEDSLAVMMMQKRNIDTPEKLEEYILYDMKNNG